MGSVICFDRTALPVCSQNAISLRFLVSAILTVISHSDSYIARAFSSDFRIEWRTSGNGAGRIKQVIQASKEANEVFTSFWDTKTGKTAYGEAAPRNAVVFGNDGWRMA